MAPRPRGGVGALVGWHVPWCAWCWLVVKAKEQGHVGCALAVLFGIGLVNTPIFTNAKLLTILDAVKSSI